MLNEAPIAAYTAADALRFAEEHPLEAAHNEDDGTPSESHEGSVAEDLADATYPKDSMDTLSGFEKEEVEPEPDESEPDGDETPEDTDEDGVLDEDDEIPQLDPLIEELAKGNPKAEKRVQEIARGLQKLKTESRQLKDELEASRPQVAFLQKWNDALADKGSAGKALEQLILSVAQHHEVGLDTLLADLAKANGPSGLSERVDIRKAALPKPRMISMNMAHGESLGNGPVMRRRKSKNSTRRFAESRRRCMLSRTNESSL